MLVWATVSLVPTPTMALIDATRVSHLAGSFALGMLSVGHLVLQDSGLGLYLQLAVPVLYLLCSWAAWHGAGQVMIDAANGELDDVLADILEATPRCDDAVRRIGEIMHYEHERSNSAPLLSLLQDLLVDTRAESHLVAVTAGTRLHP